MISITVERNRRGIEWPEYYNWRLPTQADKYQSRLFNAWHDRERGSISESSNLDSKSRIKWRQLERRPIIGANCPKHR